ncbi:MAG: hypothetical protein ACRBCK_11580 [Alphaproteobacteria bacterium]
MLRLISFCVIIFLLFPSGAFSCALQGTDKEKENLISKAEFIGIVRIVDRQEYESGRKKSAVMRPFMVYKSSENFDPAVTFEIKFEEMWTSCDIAVNELYSLQEVIILKNEEGAYIMGEKGIRGQLGKHWDIVRSQVSYVWQ